MGDTTPTVSIQVNVVLRPFGQAEVMSGHAHPERLGPVADDRLVTQVLPLTSSAITPGHTRPASL